jgi:phenylalanyl-tRNA synthetase beta chain
MLVSLKWLRDYIEIDIGPEELAERLSMAGIEVESVDEKAPDFTDVVVAKVLSVKPHPNADKLSLCEVATADRTYSVVCGAPNIAAGILAPFAKVGATIPGGYSIKHSKIRGELSEGMLCSEEELGVGDDASGIMILPEKLSVGENLAEALDLKDIVLNVGVTPNRSDCLSIVGIAREVAAITGKRVAYPPITFSEGREDIEDITSVDILNPDLCPRYTARVIKNVTIKPSPFWIKQRLEAVGLRAINNVVDVTNFVMMELGQPLHAFDFRFLEEGRIVVRGAAEGEKFISLDEKERVMRADTLMICDGVKPVAVAGIMGGLNSEVGEDTETVLLESAYFNPSSIRKSARVLGMNTDAAFRFERGIDPEGVIRALNRAARLIADLSGGTVCRGYIDRYPKKVETVTDIPLRVDRINKILGITIDADEVRNILERLEMNVRSDTEGNYRVTPPTFRVDILREADLIEEIARIKGYDNIPVTLPTLSAGTNAGNQKNTLAGRIKGILNGCGYSEVINYSFTTPRSAQILNLPENDKGRKFIKLRDPLSEDMSVMRTMLVYGLLETARKNINVGNIDLEMFEIGNIFIDSGSGKLPFEKEHIAALVTGARYGRSWHFKGLDADFYDMKGVVENVLDALKIESVEFKPADSTPFLHPGRSCLIVGNDTVLGFMGEVHPEVLERMDLKQRVVVFELDMAVMLSFFSDKILYKEIPKFPFVSRDVAFVVDHNMKGRDMVKLALESGKKTMLDDVSIFDVYAGEGIPAGKKSLAIKFTYRSLDRTLTDNEVNKVHDMIVGKIVKSTGAEIRGADIS